MRVNGAEDIRRMNLSKAKQAIRDSQFRYKKGLGQHFLYDENLLKELVDASGVTHEDGVLEIGPGSGSMTAQLAKACRKVIAMELDETLLPILRVTLSAYENVDVIQGDVLAANLPDVVKPLGDSFCVVANIPYYITSPLLTLLLSGKLPIKRMAVMVQKEVAGKVMALPGGEDYGMLAVRAQYYCDPFVARIVPASAFTPPPKVDSAFVVMPFRQSPPVSVKDEDVFFRMASAAFLMRRKTMLNNLQSAFSLARQDAANLLASCGLDERVRGETLGLSVFAALANAYSERKEV
jgi:16S rRNA (adenine1518-N6/adenine1519-N6)-dimethyltransferase